MVSKSPSSSSSDDQQQENPNPNPNSKPNESDNKSSDGSDEESESDTQVPLTKTIQASDSKKVDSKAKEVEMTAKNGSVPKQVDSSKKSPHGAIERVFSGEDEIKVLEWVFECKGKTGADPNNLEAFQGFVKGSINVTRDQLMAKIRRLKAKYSKNAGKRERGDFGNDQDWKLFELSKKIWLSDDVKSSKKAKKVDFEVKEVEVNAKRGKRKEDRSDNVVKKGSNSKRLKKLDVLEEDQMEVDQQKVEYKRKKAELELMRLQLVKEQTDMLAKVLMK